jgi:hypothetical protein
MELDCSFDQLMPAHLISQLSVAVSDCKITELKSRLAFSIVTCAVTFKSSSLSQIQVYWQVVEQIN